MSAVLQIGYKQYTEQVVQMSEEQFFNDGWCLYFHDPDAKDWNESATQLLITIQSVQDFIALSEEFKDLWSQGMFFLMREHIQPAWEDPHCRNGGCISYKINKPEVPKAWFELCAKALGESLFKNPKKQWSNICGVSISPKRNYCILRIWVTEHKFGNVDLYDLPLPTYSTVQYRSHAQHQAS